MASSITINSCCDLTALPYNKAPSDVYRMRKCMPDCEETAPLTRVTSDVYCNMYHDFTLLYRPAPLHGQ